MTIYETIKAAISVKQAAEHYGLKVSRNGMVCCPFHNDRHPSMKLNEGYFFCFGCGAKGDVIDLVAKLFDLSSYETAQRLVSDFCLDPDKPIPKSIQRKSKIRTEAQWLKENERLCFFVLNEYLWLLRDWQKQYAPQMPQDTMDDRFVEACHKIDPTEYRLDILLQGDSHKRSEIINERMAEGYIHKVQARLRKEKHHEQTCMD